MVEFFLTHCLEKVFPDRAPDRVEAPLTLYALRGDIPALQLVYRYRSDDPKNNVRPVYTITVEGAPTSVRLRNVALMSSDFPCYNEADAGYLTDKPGLFPDLLEPIEGGEVALIPRQYRAIWVDFPDLADVPAGTYAMEIVLRSGTEEQRLPFTLALSRHALAAQELLHTEWFHADCLADYYGVTPWDAEHWRIVENFMAAAAAVRINMLMTPVFTPPLDTAPGLERTTVQLVDISAENGGYVFDFSRLEKWCALCKKHGMTHIEIPPFFTQWGAEYTPKIVVRKDGREEKLFGWHVGAGDARYRVFLEAFVPALQAALAGFGYDRALVYYHVSDEPTEKQIDSYHVARNQIIDLLAGCPMIDALSEYSFYEKGLVPLPVVANDHIQRFIDEGAEALWVYYCCGQNIDVPNRFFALPSARNRIMGVLMYLYNIKGFLHWGFNFYNAQNSTQRIDPYRVSHAGYAFPSGDPFLVYPGADGTALFSIRAETQRMAMEDFLALKTLEGLVGRVKVEEIVYNAISSPMTFKEYPQDAGYQLGLRKRIWEALAEYNE